MRTSKRKRATRKQKKETSISFDSNESKAAKAFAKLENQLKSRRLDAPCWDHSRVLLFGTGSGHWCSTDYIHANWVHGYRKRMKFIATQAPMLDSIDDFLAMVWQNSCKYIVVLTKIMEEGVQKCFPYWPTRENAVKVSTQWIMKLRSKDCWAGHTKYVLSLRQYSFQQERRTIELFHYTNWLENREPESQAELNTFILKIRSVMALNCRKDKRFEAPIVVHGSDGINRTITYCMLHDIADMMDENQCSSAEEMIPVVLERMKMTRYTQIQEID